MRVRVMFVCVLLAASASAAHAQAPTTTTPTGPATIGAGVTAGGVDLAGLTVTAAAKKIRAQTTTHVIRPLSLGVAGLHFRLSAAQARLRLDATATATAALAAPSADTSGQGGGAAAGTVVPLVISHSPAAVTAFVNQIATRVHVSPQDATLDVGLRHQVVTRAVTGHELDAPATVKLVNDTLDDPDQTWSLHVAVVTLRPKVNTGDIERANPTIVTVDRAHFVLRLFKHLKIAKRYPIAVGRAGLQTPTGTYHVQDKQINPAWHVPNSSWAGSLAGQTIPPGPGDPLVARWMGLAAGVGIHGTNEPWTVGSAASHGCIRMRVPDVIALFDRVPVGTPVLIR